MYMLVSTKGVGAVVSSYVIFLKRNKVDTSRALYILIWKIDYMIIPARDAAIYYSTFG